MRSASQSGARRAGALAIAALLVLVVAIAMVVAGCPDDSANGTTTVTYTCENGTPVDGTPSGTSNVERCASCVSGYTLSGSAGADGATCMKDAVDSTAPTFTDGPTVDGTTDTGATVKLTADEAGKLFWVLYADGTEAPVTAAALIQDASGDSAGVKRSGANEAVTTAERTVTLSGLTPGTTYNFYAVLQDSAGNTSDLSKKLEITTAMTATTGSYTCENGTAKGGTPTGSTDVVACQSCSDGFKLTGTAGENTTACIATQYTCENGMPKTDTLAGSTDMVACQSCDSGYTLSSTPGAVGTTCTDNPPTFSAGPTPDTSTDTTVTLKLTASEAGKLFWVLYADGAITATPSATALIAAASGSTVGVKQSGASETVDAATEKTVTISGLAAGTSYDFYAVLQDSAGNNGTVSAKLDIATATGYTCTDGMPKTGSPGGSTNVVLCASCSSGFKLAAPSGGVIGDDNTTCVATVYTCSKGTPADGSGN